MKPIKDALHNSLRSVVSRTRAVCCVAFFANSHAIDCKKAPCSPSRADRHSLARVMQRLLNIVIASDVRANLHRLIDENAALHQPVFINNDGAGGGVELPFGGVKSSGHGREKGLEALAGFSVLKTVVFRHG